MKSIELEKPQNGSDNFHRRVLPDDSPAGSSILRRSVVSTLAVIDRELRKLRHDPVDLVTRAVQPALWLLIFGQVFTRTHAIPTGDVSYIEFLAPGVLAQSVLFVAIFNGISVISERDLGIVHKFLASPAPRASLVLGKSLAGGIRALIQAVVVTALSATIGVRLSFSPVHLLGVLLLVLLGATVFSTFSLIIACLVKTRERFMGIGQILTMPLFFASSAIYPVSMMPDWLKVVSRLNPLTYQVDGLRRLMLEGYQGSILPVVGDGALLFGVLIVFITICARLYPNLVR